MMGMVYWRLLNLNPYILLLLGAFISYQLKQENEVETKDQSSLTDPGMFIDGLPYLAE